MNRRLLLLAPLAVAGLGGAAFWSMLAGMKNGTFDPRGVPSMLIGKPMPDFVLPGFTAADVRAMGHPVVINFFASWCVPCIEEAPTLVALARAGVPLWGIAYKDKPAATDTFLARHGNPFARLARDEPGSVAIDWGVTGVPETYLVDADGVVRWRFVGPLPAEAVPALAARLRG
jgi:cytochrome c biogenesis protein CcmG, thiol:disulfide interchange protein DsbE